MPGIERQAVMTPISIADLWNETLLSWEKYGTPTRKAIELFLAQVGVEIGFAPTGMLPICYNYNIGNKRPNASQDFCKYSCGEELRLPVALKICEADPQHASIARRYVREQTDEHGSPAFVAMASVKFKPPHESTKFRAYQDLRSSAESLIKHLADRPKCWAALQEGKIFDYCVALREALYFTAAHYSYNNCMVARMNQIRKITDLYNWGDVA
jgi:hypothetical protein